MLEVNSANLVRGLALPGILRGLGNVAEPHFECPLEDTSKLNYEPIELLNISVRLLSGLLLGRVQTVDMTNHDIITGHHLTVSSC